MNNSKAKNKIINFIRFDINVVFAIWLLCCIIINIEIMIDWNFKILIFHSHMSNKIWQKMIKNKHISNKIKYNKKNFSMITHAINYESWINENAEL